MPIAGAPPMPIPGGMPPPIPPIPGGIAPPMPPMPAGIPGMVIVRVDTSTA
jgi:formin 2